MPSTEWLVVADDLTGATDTGHEFARRGYETSLLLGDNGESRETDVAVINTDSRYSSPEVAGDLAGGAVRSALGAAVYKKVDSTLRGNLTAEISAVLGGTDAPLAVLAPAFPANGRTTAAGYHLVDGRLVTDTTAGRDPDKPVTDAHVPTLLATADRPVEHVDVGTVARGTDAVREALTAMAARHDRSPIVACDATHDRHLETIATATARMDPQPLYVGSAGFARALAVSTGDPATTSSVERETPTNSGALGVVGSTNPQTLSQLETIDDSNIVSLNLAATVTEPDAAAQSVVPAVVERLREASSVVVTSATSEDDVEVALRAAEEAGIDPDVARDRIARTLARVAADTFDERRPSGLFLSGGAVATDVLTALDATEIRLTGVALEAGIPVSRVHGGVADGTVVITKAGAFGERETVIRALSYLGATDDR